MITGQKSSLGELVLLGRYYVDTSSKHSSSPACRMLSLVHCYRTAEEIRWLRHIHSLRQNTSSVATELEQTCAIVIKAEVAV